MSDTRYALVCDGNDGSLGAVALRLVRLGVDVLYAKSVDEAWLLAAQEGESIHAVVFPPELDTRNLARLTARIGSDGEFVPTLVVVGPRPDPEGLERLRAAGVQRAVWEPCDDGALRFVVNQALTLPAEMADRREPRVATGLLASFRIDGVRHDAVIYTLSRRGAFVETPGPPPKGSQVELEIWLPETLLRTTGRVVNVKTPGEAGKPRCPTGMSVVFGELEGVQATYLRRYVEEHAAGFTV